MSSSAPCAQPTATLATASAISAGIGTRTIGASRAGRVAHRVEGSLRGHDHRVDVEVVAAGPAEAGHRPRVLDHDLVRGEDGDAKAGDAVDDRLDAVAVDPVGVLAAAGEAPPAGHAVAVVDGGDRAGRVEHAGRDDVGRIGEQLVEAGARQRGQVAPRARSDHHGPAHRRVGPGERLVHAHGAGQVGVDAAVRRRPRHAEHARGDQLVEQVAGHPAAGFDLVRASGDGRRQAPRGVQHALRRRDSCIRCGHRLLPPRPVRANSDEGDPGKERALRSNSPTAALGARG